MRTMCSLLRSFLGAVFGSLVWLAAAGLGVVGNGSGHAATDGAVAGKGCTGLGRSGVFNVKVAPDPEICFRPVLTT